MTWPARYPDVSPIESIWAGIDRELLKSPPENMTELEADIARHWNNYPREKCIKLIESMPQRVMDCIKAKGRYNKY